VDWCPWLGIDGGGGGLICGGLICGGLICGGLASYPAADNGP
jgi:hypothetical protein